MNILFLTLVNIDSMEEKQNIYSDLCRSLMELGHTVNIVCPSEHGKEAGYFPYHSGSGLLKVSIGAVQKTGLLKKGINTLLFATRFKKAIRLNFPETKFDLIIYSTPPITVYPVVKYLKKRDHAVTYLLLRDIFPQNAIDLNMLSKTGVKGMIYRYFKRTEKKLYLISDQIGTMSKANTAYLLDHETYLRPEQVEEAPNSFYPYPNDLTDEKKKEIRKKYDLPADKTILVYGGNLGKPQGIPHLCECLRSIDGMENIYTVICGNGTDYAAVEQYLAEKHLGRVKLLRWLPREEYEEFISACDIGLIFLDHRLSIPNFPSRLLSYMHKKMPVLACTDTVSDIRDVIEEGKFGWWCPSDRVEEFTKTVEGIGRFDVKQMGKNAAEYLFANYSSAETAQKIVSSYERHRS